MPRRKQSQPQTGTPLDCSAGVPPAVAGAACPYYDHRVRDEAEFLRAINYVAENPAKAGLIDWH